MARARFQEGIAGGREIKQPDMAKRICSPSIVALAMIARAAFSEERSSKIFVWRALRFPYGSLEAGAALLTGTSNVMGSKSPLNSRVSSIVLPGFSACFNPISMM